MPRFNGTELTPETIAATRQHFADLADTCIRKAKSGEFCVNDLPGYIAWQEQRKTDALQGKNDHTFTFLQYAYYIQTGVSVPLLNAYPAKLKGKAHVQ